MTGGASVVSLVSRRWMLPERDAIAVTSSRYALSVAKGTVTRWTGVGDGVGVGVGAIATSLGVHVATIIPPMMATTIMPIKRYRRSNFFFGGMPTGACDISTGAIGMLGGVSGGVGCVGVMRESSIVSLITVLQSRDDLL